MNTSGQLVVFAIGNDARGDDALGPLLARRIEQGGFADLSLFIEYQLQIEHALDLRDAAAVLFIDAAKGLARPFEFGPVEAEMSTPVLSHALSPAVLLGVYRRIEGGPPPPAVVLALRGEAFELGAPLSASAAAALESAWAWLNGRLSASALLASGAAAHA